MFGWTEYLREKREREAAAREAKLVAEEQKYFERVNAKHEEMLSLLCAINGMNNCSDNCIHFKHGRVYRLVLLGEACVDYNLPTCKLWR